MFTLLRSLAYLSPMAFVCRRLLAGLFAVSP
jgi:hypothetical protein